MTESQADTERRKDMMFDTFGWIGKVAEFFGSTKLFVGLTVLFAIYMVVDEVKSGQRHTDWEWIKTLAFYLVFCGIFVKITLFLFKLIAMIVTGAFTVQCTLWGCALILFFAHMSD